MKKIISVLLLFTFFAGFSFAAREFVEGTDYFVDFKQNEDNMAAVIHINFIDMMPAPAEAERILKDQLKVYAKIIETDRENLKKEKEAEEKELAKKDKSKKDKKKEKPKKIEDIKDPEELKAFFEDEDAKEEKYKNIIGSVWYTPDGNPENMEKVQYGETYSAFVLLGKTKRTVPFPDYIKFLKKEKEDRKQKEKERAKLLRQLQQGTETEGEDIEILEEPQP